MKARFGIGKSQPRDCLVDYWHKNEMRIIIAATYPTKTWEYLINHASEPFVLYWGKPIETLDYRIKQVNKIKETEYLSFKFDWETNFKYYYPFGMVSILIEFYGIWYTRS